VKDLGNSQADSQIIGAIIALADRLGFNVVAEGVETGAQAEILKESQCELLQGYLFSRPVASDDFANLMTTKRVS
jgi:EAL domain-containing protein (putative c-di-GMP-specific phosphodiesterase class I)